MANDVFDTVQGADDANVTPTQFSGGSRVIQYGLVSLRQMATLATVFYVLAGSSGSCCWRPGARPALLVIGVVGFIVSLGYTAPPLKFVYRGLGEIAVAIGFGPLMLLGAYVVQTGGALAWEPFVASIPVAVLVALILYVNEIPDRRGDARVGKRTLPVRWSRERPSSRPTTSRSSWPTRRSSSASSSASCPSRRCSCCCRSRWPSRSRAAWPRTTTTRMASWRSWASTSSSTCAPGCSCSPAYAIVLVLGAVAPAVPVFIGG